MGGGGGEGVGVRKRGAPLSFMSFSETSFTKLLFR